MKICIFGGSFNPIHNGHLYFIDEVRKKIQIDKFIIIPVNVSPLKQDIKMANNSDRLKMLNLGLVEFQDCIVDDYEIKKGGISYSIDTVKKMKDKYGKENEYFYLIGSDNICVIKMWKEYKKLLKSVKFIVVPRDNFKINQIEKDILNRIQLVSIKEIDVSSTKIRNSIKGNKSISKFVPESVAEYIKKNKLYK